MYVSKYVGVVGLSFFDLCNQEKREVVCYTYLSNDAAISFLLNLITATVSVFQKKCIHLSPDMISLLFPSYIKA